MLERFKKLFKRDEKTIAELQADLAAAIKKREEMEDSQGKTIRGFRVDATLAPTEKVLSDLARRMQA